MKNCAYDMTLYRRKSDGNYRDYEETKENEEEEGEEEEDPYECLKAEYWHAVVEVIQLPFQDEKRLHFKEFHTWLVDSMRSPFGMRLICEGGLKFEFYWSSKDEKSALMLANSRLHYFRHLFPGFDGTAFVRCIKGEVIEIERGKKNYELKLPKPPYRDPLQILSLISTLSTQTPSGVRIQFDLLFFNIIHKKKRDYVKKYHEGYQDIDPRKKIYPVSHYTDLHKVDEIKAMWDGTPFCHRIFFKLGFDQTNYKVGKSETLMHINALINSLTKGIVNLHGESANMVNDDECIPLYVAEVHHPNGTMITGKVTDYNFDLNGKHNLPIRRAKSLPGENYTPMMGLSNSDKMFILGDWKKDGVVQNVPIFIPTNDAVFDFLIAGNPGMGKTAITMNIVNQLANSRKKVGTLVILTAKKGEYKVWEGFKVFHYPFFSLPYGILGSDPFKSIQELSVNLAMGAFGLLDFSRRFFQLPLQDYYMNMHLKDPERFRTPLPKQFNMLMKKALEHISGHYDLVNRQRIYSVVEQRIDVFTDNADFLKVTEYSEKMSEILDCFLNKGEKVVVDLTSCSEDVKRFLVMSLLQSIITCTEDRNEHNGEELLNLIVFDEAHDLFKREGMGDPTSDVGQQELAMNNLLERFFTEFRSRGISTIMSDQRPSTLIQAAVTQPAIKILFKLDRRCASLFAHKADLLEFITEQPKYSAVVLNGITGERCWMQTRPILKI